MQNFVTEEKRKNLGASQQAFHFFLEGRGKVRASLGLGGAALSALR
jgi:hypothetical protein